MLSVIMPTKNSARFLRRALDSLKKQTYPYEFLVCDGGSTDGTLDILKEYGITPISFKDEGWWDGMNIGLKQAKGKIFLQFNSDDELLDGAFVKLAEFFGANPDCEWAYSPCDLVSSTNIYTMGTDPIITLPKMLNRNLIPGMAVYFRPEFFQKHGYFDGNFPFAGDYELWCRAISQGSIPLQIPHKFVIYHSHGDNMGLRIEGVKESEIIKKRYA